MKSRKELQERVSDKVVQMTGCRYYLQDIRVVIDALFLVIKEALVNDEEIKIYGFGIFKPYHYPDKRVRSPKTKEMVTVPAHRIVRFYPGKLLSKAVVDGTVHYGQEDDDGNEVDDAEVPENN